MEPPAATNPTFSAPDEAQQQKARQSTTSTSTATTPTATMRQTTAEMTRARLQEYDRYEDRTLHSPVSVLTIKQEIKPETSIGVDNLVASYVDSTTFLHSPSNMQSSPMDMQSSPMDIQSSVLVSGQSTVSLTSDDLSPDDLSSSGHGRFDPLNLNMSGMGMVNPNAVTNRRHQGSTQSGSSNADHLPCKLGRSFCRRCCWS